MPEASSTRAQILSWLDDRRDAMVEMLRVLVDLDSGSADKAGIDATGDVVIRFLEEAGIGVETIRDDVRGNALVASLNGRQGGKPVLLLGHRDTVFPKGEAARRPFTIADGRAYGPGVADMKAGVVINAFVLAAFAAARADAVPLTGLFTGDEEIASPFSRPIIERYARGSRAVLNTEPARPNGNVVTGRKGAVFMRLAVKGKAAHSGVNFFEGASAVDELACKIVRLRALTDKTTGITLNVGLIQGGQTVNTVAPSATADIDLRYVRLEDRQATLAAIERIAGETTVDGTSAALTILGEFLPMEPSDGSRQLFELYRDVAAESGVRVEGEFTGGCSDSGFASAQGTPTLCSLGAVGGKSHTPDEYIELSTLHERARILAEVILRLG